MIDEPSMPLFRRKIPGRFIGLISIMILAVSLVVLSWVSGLNSNDAINENQHLRKSGTLAYLDHVTALSRFRLGSMEESEITVLAKSMVSEALLSDKIPEEASALVFPTPGELLAMLARDRDVDDFIENSTEEGAAGEYYKKVVEFVPEMKPLRSRYEALFSGAYSGLLEMGRLKVPSQVSESANAYKSGVTLPKLSSRPREREYNLSHTYALDIFFMNVEYVPLTTLEKGPLVFSLEEGIVVGSDSSWRGGEEMYNYRSGGITPKAGNGVILYSPTTRKYYLYFHLFDVLVTTGDIVPKGFPLGNGGNTGTNARKPGHGEHLHLEIYDAERNRFLRNREIAEIVF